MITNISLQISLPQAETKMTGLFVLI